MFKFKKIFEELRFRTRTENGAVLIGAKHNMAQSY